MNADSVLDRVLAALDSAGIPYMLTGSFASAFYGLPRATQDIDLVIEPTGAQLTQFLEALSGVPVYVSPVAARDALDRHSQFNVIDLESGWKIDLIVRKERPFSRVEFDRRIEATIDTRRIPVATAEDVLLAKLEWAKAGGSRRQIEDAAGILKVRHDLDEAYLAHWVRELGVESEWREANAVAGREPSAR